MFKKIILVMMMTIVLGAMGIGEPNGHGGGDPASVVETISPEVDRIVRSRWHHMLNRLLAGDLGGALTDFSPEVRVLYKERLKDLQRHPLPAFVYRREPEAGYPEQNRVMYRLQEEGPEGMETYRIWFQRDLDGEWRIQEF
jgi:hypothetical protein